MFSSVISLSFLLVLASFANPLKASSASKSSTADDDNSPSNPTKFSIALDHIKIENKMSDDTKSYGLMTKSLKSSKKSEETNDYDEDYDDNDGDEEGGYENENNGGGGGGGGGGKHGSRQRNINIIKRVGTTYAWGRWEKWSRCSNSCVQIRKRQCIKRIQNTTDSEAVEITFYPDLADKTTGCFGIMKKYRLCKDEKCKFSNRQMRDEQCSTFNRQQYKGKFYTWQGYEKEHNECELYCKPIKSDIFISMNQSVTDGTPCEKPAVYYTHYYRRKAVCVEGICKVIVINPFLVADLN